MKKKSIGLRILNVCLVLVSIAGIGVLYVTHSLLQGNLDLHALKIDQEVQKEHFEVDDKDAIVFEGKRYIYNEDLINILVMGVDSSGAIEKDWKVPGQNGQADQLLLVSYDAKKNETRFLEIPRDIKTQLTIYDQKGGYYGKENLQLCLQYAYGRSGVESCELMVDDVTNILFGVPIQRYFAMNFEGLKQAVNYLGGIDVLCTNDYSYLNPSYTVNSYARVDGMNIESFVRRRDTSVLGSNLGRIERLKDFIRGMLLRTGVEFKKNPAFVLNMYTQLDPYLVSNISTNDITYLVSEIFESIIDIDDISVLPGVYVDGEKHDEYVLDDIACKKMMIELFYKPLEEHE